MARARKKGMIVGDRRTHAVRMTLTGMKALCGAGRVNLTLPDQFDPEEPSACAECAKAVRQ
jgi:hypothetical protein